MRKLAAVVFFTVLVYSLVSSLRRITKLFSCTADRLATFYGQISVTSNYYVGMKVTVLKIKPVFRYTKVDYLWVETCTKNKQIAENIRDYIKRQMPTIADLVIIRKASPVKDSGRDDMRIKSMCTTPGVNADEHHMLNTIATILSAGKLIRDNFKRKPKWNDL